MAALGFSARRRGERCPYGVSGACAFEPACDLREIGAVLEVRHGRHAHRDRAGVADAALDRPAEHRERSQAPDARRSAARRPPPTIGSELLDALHPERLTVGGGDLQQHLDLVGGHDRHVGTGNRRDRTNEPVLQRRCSSRRPRQRHGA